MLRVVQAARVMQRRDSAVGSYAQFMRRDMFDGVLHELEGVYKHECAFCSVIVTGSVSHFLGMFDTGTAAA
jgi:hypothetical protein